MTSLSRFLQQGLGALAVASVLASAAQAQTLGCTVGSANGGAIPTSGTGGGTPPTFPMISTLSVASVPPGATVVTEVKLIGLFHTYGADLQWVLTDPAGNAHNLIGQANGYCDYGGDYTIVGQCVGGSPFPTCTGAPVPSGTYEQDFGFHVSGNYGIFNTPLNTIPAATGTWTLTCYDWYGGDIGTLSSWDLCFGTAAPASAPVAAPTLTSPVGNTGVTLPVTLNWDNVNCATSYDVDVDGTITTGIAGNSFNLLTATPGTHTWSVRGVNTSGAGPWSLAEGFVVPQPPPPSTCTGPGGASAGSVPASGSGGTGSAFPNTFPQSPYTYTTAITPPPGATSLVKVELDFTTPHTWAGDLQFVLTNPAGVSHNLFCREGGSCDLSGVYSIYAASGIAWSTGCGGGVLPSGDYLQSFGTWPSGTNNVFNTPIDQIPISAGNWTLTIYDWAGGDVGVLGEWKLCFDSGPAVPVAFCTAGTTTNGCAASISANANPSASLAGPCNITVTNVEGQKSGLIFYSILPVRQGAHAALEHAGLRRHRRPVRRHALARLERLPGRQPDGARQPLGRWQPGLGAGVVPRPAGRQGHEPLQRDRDDLPAVIA
ncbi:MAG: hypothetical protein HUU28_11760 [Planctomycetaceae bacterium]|nr:hypothetical protein [Planctomycetaceae bacterium]